MIKRQAWRKWLVIGALIAIFIGIGDIRLAHSRDSQDLDPGRTIFMLSSYLKGDIITHADTRGEKLVALTFDDGPDPVYTPPVLRVLRQYQVRATFFVVGESALAYPSLVRQEMAEGHEVENHTLTHPELDKDSALQMVSEIVANQDVIEGITGRYPLYFRPPKRLYNREVVNTAHAHGLTVVLWTVGVENHSCPTPAQMAKRVIGKARPGAIILAHDGLLNRERTVEALPAIIKGYREKGYVFVTLQDLLAYSRQESGR